jgi:L-idonate 5-dehydrogenase
MTPPVSRAAVVSGPKRFALQERAVPEPGPGEARVRVEACGVCGSDLAFHQRGLFQAGQVPGHEMAGRVDALGEGVRGVALGARVAVEPVRTCGACDDCRSGRDSLCRDFRVHGIHLPGGFAEHVLVPAERLYPVPEDVDPAVAALAEPLAVAVHGLRQGGLEKGQRVLVLGAGNVGLAALVTARAMGAGEVFASARYPAQAEMARELGATRVLDESEATPEALARGGTDFDLVVESVGRGDTLRAAGAALRPGGTVSVLGVFFEPVELEPMPLFLKEARLVWSNCYHRRSGDDADFALATRLLDSERERLARLVTHRLPLTSVARAFELAADRRAGAIKVSVAP